MFPPLLANFPRLLLDRFLLSDLNQELFFSSLQLMSVLENWEMLLLVLLLAKLWLSNSISPLDIWFILKYYYLQFFLSFPCLHAYHITGIKSFLNQLSENQCRFKVIFFHNWKTFGYILHFLKSKQMTIELRKMHNKMSYS